MAIGIPYQSNVFLMNKRGELFNVTHLISECIITIAVDDIITADCTFYERNEKGGYFIDKVKMEISKYTINFPLISAKINNKGTRIVLDALGFVIPSFLNPYVSFWDKIFKTLAKGFL